MTEERITVGSDGPPPEQDVPDGTWPLILSDILPPKTVTAKSGRQAGQDIRLRDWIFAVDAPGHPLDGRVIDTSTSLASGPRSKQYEILTALHNGVPPTEGTSFGKADLVGRRLYGVVQHEGGWPRLVGFAPIPVTQLQAGYAAATGAPVSAPPPPVAPPVAVPTAPPAAAAPVAAPSAISAPLPVPGTPVAAQAPAEAPQPAPAAPARDDLPF